MLVLSRGRSRAVGAVVMLVMVLMLPAGARASHIIGGDMGMQAVGKTPGLFRLQLTQYVDGTQAAAATPDLAVRLLIYRKNNPVLIEAVVLQFREYVSLTFANEACANLRRLNFLEGRYYDTHQFDPQKYTDPGGYFIVWERCCRNDALTNVNVATSSEGVGMVFYLEFPPMTKTGVNLFNSSPDFGVPNGDYICINKPFSYNAAATDADGDQLRYSLVTPLNGYTTRDPANASLDGKPIVPRNTNNYPTIPWAPGYGLTNIIPGNPPLSIDATTGQLTVRASKEGIFLFTVQCEEFRNGVRIGVVRRDFQLPVVDCSKNTPPPSPILVSGKLAADTILCASQPRTLPLVLAVEKDPVWAYQWQRDGLNLRGSTSDTLQVRQSGAYTVIKSRANVCANDTVSQAVKVTITRGAPLTLSVTSTAPYCTGDTLTLRVTESSTYQYNWRRNGQDLVGEKQATIRVSQPGLYLVRVRDASVAVCGEGRDSLDVRLAARPTAQVRASALSFCPGDSVQLTADNPGGYRYTWQQNGNRLTDTTSRVTARQAGVYQAMVTAPTGCTASSGKLTITQNALPVIQFDSIALVCNTSSSIALQGKPGGGTYTGPGVVQGNRFDPAVAGLGRHKLTYTVTSEQGCRAEQSRWAVVASGLTLTGQTSYSLLKGDSVQLITQAGEPVSRYQWEPPASLNRVDIASPVARPIETTSYQLVATGTSGCIARLSVLVDVTNFLYIPTAFTPNGDGLNDAWVIQNIGSFPQCDVWIYNRWGSLIFYSRGYAQPWDGTYRETVVDTGIYTYQIRVGSGALAATYSGSLMVVH